VSFYVYDITTNLGIKGGRTDFRMIAAISFFKQLSVKSPMISEIQNSHSQYLSRSWRVFCMSLITFAPRDSNPFHFVPRSRAIVEGEDMNGPGGLGWTCRMRRRMRSEETFSVKTVGLRLVDLRFYRGLSIRLGQDIVDSRAGLYNGDGEFIRGCEYRRFELDCGIIIGCRTTRVRQKFLRVALSVVFRMQLGIFDALQEWVSSHTYPAKAVKKHICRREACNIPSYCDASCIK
jgi:hypothetical protein